jgi:hypothetical protein
MFGLDVDVGAVHFDVIQCHGSTWKIPSEKHTVVHIVIGLNGNRVSIHIWRLSFALSLNKNARKWTGLARPSCSNSLPRVPLINAPHCQPLMHKRLSKQACTFERVKKQSVTCETITIKFRADDERASPFGSSAISKSSEPLQSQTPETSATKCLVSLLHGEVPSVADARWTG